MIKHTNGVFYLATAHSSYVFRMTASGHPEQIYYGERLEPPGNIDTLVFKRTAIAGSSVLYDDTDETGCLDTIPLEWSGIGKGDYRHTPAELRMPDGSFVTDFVFKSFRTGDGPLTMATLPNATADQNETTTIEPISHLVITLHDPLVKLELDLVYTVFPACDVITRRVVLHNRADISEAGINGSIRIRRLMSLMLDLPDWGFSLTTLHGGWIREGQRQEQPLTVGVTVRESTTGSSSNRHNPAFLLAEQGAGENHGRVYGFNLVYSGNHYEAIEKTEIGLVRLMSGINPHCFEWELQPGECFETPEAVMTFSACGYNGTSSNFHAFVNRHIVPPSWRGRERPVLINSWEAHYFKFDQAKLLKLARQAADLGVELFVLDDGWFGSRNDDRSGLGDYTVNPKKFPRGLASFGRKLEKLGLQFGLWFEPEMINPDSDLYRAHPEFAVQIPGRPPAMGRHQLVLDLCQPQVRDYIVESVGRILDECPIHYVKWDMNRHISDMYSAAIRQQGEFFHRYILGLYEVLRRIFDPRPQILLESCSSGGNRFDLGMLCFSPQIWASDNIDPIERLDIQNGLSLFYPLSTMGSHVADSPHSQTLRQTTLATRFQVAAFGCLGYELNLNFLDRLQKKEVQEQIAFYKTHRRLFQFGQFRRLASGQSEQVHWQVTEPDRSAAIAGLFQKQRKAGSGFDRLLPQGLGPSRTYRLRTRPLRLSIERFGGLINHLLPIAIKPTSPLVRLAGKYYTLPDCVETYFGSGQQLMAGVMLNSQYSGTGYNTEIRMLGDFGSNLYLIEEQDEQTEPESAIETELKMESEQNAGENKDE